MLLLSKFRQTSRIGKLKTVDKGQVCCQVGFSEELIAVFKLKKKLKLAPYLTENNPKFPIFQNFHTIVEIPTDFAIGKLKTVIQVRYCCAVVFNEEMIAVFMLKMSHIGSEIDKKPKFFEF